MSPRPRLDEQIPDLQTAIIDAAWQQIANKGAAALSLRAIARSLGITAPAIYNYFPRRDDLVTALVIEAFTSFGDSQIEARDAVSSEDLVGRFQAIGIAYRRWALNHPQRYNLIFGTPIPGYEAPMDQVFPSAVRSLSALVSVVEAFRQQSRLSADSFPEIDSEYEMQFVQWKNYGGEVDILSLSVSMLIWCRVHGLVSLELSRHIPPFGPDGDALYRYEIESIKQQFIKE